MTDIENEYHLALSDLGDLARLHGTRSRDLDIADEINGLRGGRSCRINGHEIEHLDRYPPAYRVDGIECGFSTAWGLTCGLGADESGG